MMMSMEAHENDFNADRMNIMNVHFQGSVFCIHLECWWGKGIMILMASALSNTMYYNKPMLIHKVLDMSKRNEEEENKRVGHLRVGDECRKEKDPLLA